MWVHSQLAHFLLLIYSKRGAWRSGGGLSSLFMDTQPISNRPTLNGVSTPALPAQASLLSANGPILVPKALQAAWVLGTKTHTPRF